MFDAVNAENDHKKPEPKVPKTTYKKY